MNNNILLSVENVVKKYGDYTALNNASISVPESSIYGLLGPNGAGKTTLMRIINQITAPDSGIVFFEGKQLNKEHIKKIGYLPEERGLYKKITLPLSGAVIRLIIRISVVLPAPLGPSKP
jgi:ABC-2 type transport system ATP-binding protein